MKPAFFQKVLPEKTESFNFHHLLINEFQVFVICELRPVKRKPVTIPIILPGFQFQQETIKHSR
ncbi:hypothetical protein ES708_15507 [subsurface metagenome]